MEFKMRYFARLFKYNVLFGDYLQYISWAVTKSKLLNVFSAGCHYHFIQIKEEKNFDSRKYFRKKYAKKCTAPGLGPLFFGFC